MQARANEIEAPRNIPRSIGAVLAGALVGVILSLGTDEAFHISGVYPPWGQRMADNLFVLATAYRIVYSVLASYTVSRIAPRRPMKHALIGGVLGLVVSLAGAAATWSSDLGPHWYSLLLAVIALPCAWLGGKLRLMQLNKAPAATTTPST
jgi:hypothetical protein